MIYEKGKDPRYDLPVGVSMRNFRGIDVVYLNCAVVPHGDGTLSIHTEGDQVVATDLADAFGPYGVPLSSLSRDEAASVASEFLLVRDWDFDQGSIPRFLSRFTNLFPDEIYDFLLRRIDQSTQAREHGQPGYHCFHLVHANISFGNVPSEKR